MRVLKAIKKKLVSWFGSWFAYWVIKVLGLTMRFEEVGPEIAESLLEREPAAIGAFWHGRLLMMPVFYKRMIYKRRKGRQLSFLVSPHRDGQVVGRALQRFGFHAILGSTTRKGYSAFKKMLEANRKGSDLAIVPDGPRGPRCQVQIGVIELAKLTGKPILPVSFGASRKKVFNTWDHFVFPYPFSKGVFIWGEPIYVDSDGDRAHLEERRVLLEKRLNDLTERADHYFDPSPHPSPPRGEGEGGADG
jgi:lysophospholipid acyltransferase (LPLAT)-like uncharacterized protein